MYLRVYQHSLICATSSRQDKSQGAWPRDFGFLLRGRSRSPRRNPGSPKRSEAKWGGGDVGLMWRGSLGFRVAISISGPLYTAGTASRNEKLPQRDRDPQSVIPGFRAALALERSVVPGGAVRVATAAASHQGAGEAQGFRDLLFSTWTNLHERVDFGGGGGGFGGRACWSLLVALGAWDAVDHQRI